MPDGESSLTFLCPSGNLRRRPLIQFARYLSHRVARGRRFDCIIARDKDLRRLNQKFLGHDYPADVLSFPSGVAHEWLGDVAISIDRARDQAAKFGHGLEDELRILMLHGVLHLTGQDHEADNGEMARVERAWRRKLGLPGGLIERSRA
jgi:probable rRNA maturation factor